MNKKNKKNVSKIIASSMIIANIPTSLAVDLIDDTTTKDSFVDNFDIADKDS